MDEEIKEVGEMATIEDEDEITINEDYTTLEGDTIIIDDDSNIQTGSEYEKAIEQKELADEAREALSAVLLSVLEKGEINDDDIAEITAQQEIYTENVTALKILGIETEDEKNTTNVITSNIDYNELMKALSEKADWLYIDEDGQVMLNGEVVPKLKVVELEAEKIKADVGEFKDLTTENFTATNATIENLKANKADIEYLNANYATIENLNATNANITNLQATKANIIDLNAANANIANLQAIKANITDLNAAKADINVLNSNVANITTLVNGNLTSDNIQSMIITGDKFTIADGFIKNAMIDSVAANKINTGTINTNNVSIQSADGSMMISGTTQQFKDKNGKVRIQIGKDASGNFTFALFSQDGVGVLIDENGIKAGAVPDGLIVNDMVADNANISGSKLDINSVINSINNGTTVIKGTRIQLDEQGQSLQVAFSQLKNKVETIENVSIEGDLSDVIEQVTSNTTSINTMQGQISSLISNTTITKENGEVVQLKDEYNSTKDTVNSHTTKIGSLETNLNKVSSGQNKWLLEMFEKGEGIDAESPITIEHIIGKPLIKAVLVDDSVTNNQSHFGDNYLGRATTHVYLDMDYNWETTATSDDGSTMYVNGTFVATFTSCNPTAITVPFKQGWNKITWVYNEGIGGDGWDFNPRLTTIPQVKYMNAYSMTNVDEVGNILDGNIKTVSSKQAILEQNLNGFKQTVSNTYTTKADFNDLEIGGRNFLVGTKNAFTRAINTANSNNNFITNDPYTTYKSQTLSPLGFKVGDKITVSFDWSLSNITTAGSFKVETVQDSTYKSLVSGPHNFGSATSGRYVGTKTLTDADININKIRIRVDASNLTMTIKNMKLEKGNKVTSWSPAPEDIDTAISTVDGKFTNYSTTSQMNSAINQKANEITSTVSETYATKVSVTDVSNNLKNNYSTTSAMNSAIKQKADSILSTVSNTYATTQSTSTLLKESITEYYLSTSNTTLSGGAWGTTSYTPTPGKYIWQRTKSVTNAGDIKYSNPICVSDEMYTVMLKNEVLLLKCNSDGEVI